MHILASKATYFLDMSQWTINIYKSEKGKWAHIDRQEYLKILLILENCETGFSISQAQISFAATYIRLVKKKRDSPTPGIEPGPPGWKPGILAIRPRGMVYYQSSNIRIWTLNDQTTLYFIVPILALIFSLCIGWSSLKLM